MEEIVPASEAEQSTKGKSSGRQGNLEGHRSHAKIIEQARRTSVDIKTSSITSPELIDLISTKRENLENKLPHPTRDKPTGRDALWRAFIGRRVPKIMQSHEATDKIIKNATSIHKMLLDEELASMLSKEQLQEIATLVSLANERYGKGYKNLEDADTRPMKEIKAELVIYQKIAERLEQQEESLRKKVQPRKIDKTLALQCEQWLKQKKIERPNRQREALMHDFAELFPEAAELIRESSPAMQLVQEAATADVVFAGYAEEGPRKINHAYTQGGHVYVPRAEADPSTTVNALLFELTNGINEDRFRQFHRMADTRTISAEKFAYKIVEIEADAVLKTGEIWTRTGETSNNPIWKQPDPDGYARIYQNYKEGKLSKAALVKLMLEPPSPASYIGNKTHKQEYIDQYNEASLSLGERKYAAFLAENGLE